MRYRVRHSTAYHYGELVSVCHNEVRLRPRNLAAQRCLAHRLAVSPAPGAIEHRRDYFGNGVDSFCIDEEHRELVVVATSEVEVDAAALPDPAASPPWEDVRSDLEAGRGGAHAATVQYRLGSPRVAPSAALAAYAAASFPPSRPWLAAVADLSRRIHADFVYDSAATDVQTPPEAVLKLGRGVCQDFAHLAIGCLRSLGLAARYVSGYLRTSPPPGKPRMVGADATHAWLAAYAPHAGWIDIDPTNDMFPTDGHVTLAWGRDYSDICPIKGVFVGGGRHDMAISVDVEPLVD